MRLLITGATGFIGTSIIARLAHLDRYDTVYVLLRSLGGQGAEARLETLLADIFPKGEIERVRGKFKAVAGDLTAPALGMTLEDQTRLVPVIDQILHLGANTDFEATLTEARMINVEGTRTVLEFSKRCFEEGRLRRLDYVSTAYVAGLRPGVVTERDLDRGQKFANFYEQTKFEAERLIATYKPLLPIVVHRPSVVVGHSHSGFTPQFKVLYWPLKLLSKGIVPFIPCRRRARLDVVPVDFVADAMVALMGDARVINRTLHLTAGLGNEVKVLQLIRDLFALTSVKRKPVVPFVFLMLFWKTPLARLIRANIREMAMLGQTYFDYYRGTGVRFRADETVSLLARYGLEPPKWNQYKTPILGYCEASRWGRRAPQPSSFYLSQGVAEKMAAMQLAAVPSNDLRVVGSDLAVARR